MAYASKAGRAKTNASAPSAFGVCDRCGIWYNLNSLFFQWDWRGTTLQNIRIRVCLRCTDVPQQQLRAFAIPADPIPVDQPRIEPFLHDEYNPSLQFNDQTGPGNGDRNSQYLGAVI